MGRLLILLGVVLVVVGVVLVLAGRVPGLGRLPGDIEIRRGNFVLDGELVIAGSSGFDFPASLPDWYFDPDLFRHH